MNCPKCGKSLEVWDFSVVEHSDGSITVLIDRNNCKSHFYSKSSLVKEDFIRSDD